MEKKVEQFRDLKYVMRYPRGFDPNKKYPLLIFLHGAGTRGNNIELLLSHPFFKVTDNFEEFSYITAAPQCGADTWFDLFESLELLVKRLVSLEYCDSSKVYIIGASMGGYGTWQLAMSMPELFAAIVPICGGGMYWNAGRLKNVPVWAFHGAKDDVVFPEESKKMVEAVNSRGGSAKLTLYPQNGHDAWTDTYSNKAVFEWLLEKTNNNTAESLHEKYNDSVIYG